MARISSPHNYPMSYRIPSVPNLSKSSSSHQNKDSHYLSKIPNCGAKFNNDAEVLQNEVLRLRQILQENGIQYDIDIVEVEEQKEMNVVTNTVEEDNEKRKGKQIVKIDHKNVEQSDVCSYLRCVLNRRFEQTINGRRRRQFSRCYKKYLDSIDGPNSIVSGHGREYYDDNIAATEWSAFIVSSNQQQKRSKKNSKMSFFPSDLSSLDMVYTPSIYNLALNEIQIKQSNEQSDIQQAYATKKSYVPTLMFRAIQLGIAFTPVTMTAGLAALSKNFRNNVWYSLVGKCLAKSGPAFIKWGQWASTRSDMFPDELCQALSDLHADAPAHQWKITQQTVEEALSIPKGTLFEIFEEFDLEPIASGSIAQVHRAVLRKCENSYDEKNEKCNRTYGETVAVKVRHPNVSQLIDMDFRLMSILADVIDRIPSLSWLRVRDSVEQFSHTMAAQAHLNVEAHHLEVLNYNFRRWDSVHFPMPIFACSSVIIETFERGEICSAIIDKYDNLAANKRSTIENDNKNSSSSQKDMNTGLGYELMPVPLAQFIVTTGLSLYLKMLLVDNLMHADLHPGNIMLDWKLFGEHIGDSSPLSSLGVVVPVSGKGRSNIKERKKSYLSKREMKLAAAELTGGFYGQICLVDAGMVAQLDDDESTNFIGLISALGEGDGRAAAEAVLRFTSQKNHDGDDGCRRDLTLQQREVFIKDMIELFDEKCRGYGTNVDFGEVVRGVLGVVKKHHVQMGANYATLVVNALCIESLAKRVCPSYNVLDASKPLLRAYHVIPYENSAAKGSFVANRPMLKRSLIRLATPFLYMQKNFNDNEFFRNIEATRRGSKALNRKASFAALLRKALRVGTIVFAIHHMLSNPMMGRNLCKESQEGKDVDKNDIISTATSGNPVFELLESLYTKD